MAHQQQGDFGGAAQSSLQGGGFGSEDPFLAISMESSNGGAAAAAGGGGGGGGGGVGDAGWVSFGGGDALGGLDQNMFVAGQSGFGVPQNGSGGFGSGGGMPTGYGGMAGGMGWGGGFSTVAMGGSDDPFAELVAQDQSRLKEEEEEERRRAWQQQQMQQQQQQQCLPTDPNALSAGLAGLDVGGFGQHHQPGLVNGMGVFDQPTAAREVMSSGGSGLEAGAYQGVRYGEWNATRTEWVTSQSGQAGVDAGIVHAPNTAAVAPAADLDEYPDDLIPF